MSKPSDLIWDFLGDGPAKNDAPEIFAEALSEVLWDDKDDTAKGIIINALENALNLLCRDPKRMKKLEEYVNWLNEDSDDG